MFVDLAFTFGLAATLIVLSRIDLQTYRLPDSFTLPLIGAGIFYAVFFGNFKTAFLGALIGYLGFVALEIGYKALRGHAGLGRGDAKLLAAGGAWCGAMGLPFIVLIASASGLAYSFLQSRDQSDKSKNVLQSRLAFGPHLSSGIFLVWCALKLVDY